MNMYTPFMVIAVVRRKRRNVIRIWFPVRFLCAGGFPTFDIVLLGAGDDGHTSSIFPGQEYLLSSFHPYEKSINPYNGQPRIAMTGCLLFSARKLIFLITGKNKTEVVYDILKSGDTGPAAYVAHHAADVDIFTDIEIDG